MYLQHFLYSKYFNLYKTHFSICCLSLSFFLAKFIIHDTTLSIKSGLICIILLVDYSSVCIYRIYTYIYNRCRFTKCLQDADKFDAQHRNNLINAQCDKGIHWKVLMLSSPTHAKYIQHTHTHTQTGSQCHLILYVRQRSIKDFFDSPLVFQ